MTGSCTATPTVYSGEAQPGEGYLSECVTNAIPSSNIRTNAPADVVLAVVNDATDERVELYRGTFPVIGFSDWTGMNNNQPVHVEQRQLRFDPRYGVGYLRQYMGQLLEFTYVTTQPTFEFPNDTSLRCKVGSGQWAAYETSTSTGDGSVVRNRVWDNGTVHED